MKNNRIKQALNNTFSSLYVSDSEARMLLAQAKGGKKVKRKLSVIAVLVTMLILSTVAAVAITLLTPKEVVDQKVLPMALDNGKIAMAPNFSSEELETIIRISEENNIHLSEYWYRALKAKDGMPKEELIKALASAEFGNYLYWTIEQQHWFGEVMTAIGAWKANKNCLPKEGDIDFKTALEKVRNWILSEYKDDVSDGSRWKMAVSFAQQLNEDGSVARDAHWWFYFAPHSLHDRVYEILMSPSGEIVSSSGKAYSMKVAAKVVEAFSEVHGSVNLWSPEIWADFGHALLQVPDTGSLLMQAYLGARYIKPPENGIDLEEAKQIALHAVNLEYTDVFVAFACMDDDVPIWKIVTHTLHPDDIGTGRFTATWMIELDCKTGSIRNKQELGFYDDPIKLYTPKSVYERILP